ncbi:disulfide bond formation protein B [Polynucleobacter sp.]|uniref:disulfide bond formation protein B n=1 Tax=Polynucleobacter sp. TaxID=2029855 RepID=UPI0025886D7F|nr:disulfide bond formation protein B [Polynucleobacter sp.]MCX7237040.1 disulfide bond formation protein B [Polynucleobacter sp.]
MSRTQYLSIAIFSLTLVVFAVLLQQAGYKNVSFLPCPLCVLQRIGFLGIAISCFLAAGLTSFKKLFHSIALLSAVFGAAIAGKQVWLLSHPESSCGIDPLEVWINQFQLAQALPWLFKADGLCSAKLPAIFGLQVPEWSLLWFCVLLLILTFTFFKKAKTKV